MAPLPEGKESALIELFVSQFGESRRKVVEFAAGARLQGRSAVNREDLDLIERSILTGLRKQRREVSSACTRRKESKVIRHSSSAPSIDTVSRAVSVESQAAAQSMLLNALKPRSRPASASASLLERHADNRIANVRCRPSSACCGSKAVTDGFRKRGIATPMLASLTPPFAVTLEVDGGEGAASSRSVLQKCPKYKIPRRPMQRPEDHWDVMVTFDAEEWRQSEKMRLASGHSQARYRAELDKQMLESKSFAEQKREAVLGPPESNEQANIAANNRELDRIEEEKKTKLREQLLANAAEDAKTIERRKQREELRTRREMEEMHRTIFEHNQKEREEKLATENSNVRVRQDTLTQLAEARESRARRKELERQADLDIIAESNRVLEVKDAKDAAVKAARLARIEKVMNTIGAQLEKSENEHAAELEERVARDCADMDRQTNEAIERKRLHHNKAIEDMVDTLGHQVEFRKVAKEQEESSKKVQAAIFKKRFEEGEIEEAAKLVRRRDTRAALDSVLIDQIRAQLVVHPENLGVTEKDRQFELAYNKKALDKMVKKGWRLDHTCKMLKDARNCGKLGHHLTIPNYEGSIHPLELQSPEP